MKIQKSRLRYSINLFVCTTLIVLIIFLALLGYVSNLWVESNLHPPRYIPTDDLLKAEHIPHKKVKLMTKDGLQLAAWYTPPKNGSVILVAHGYGANRPQNIYAMLTWHGYGVLAWDFRAHGDSQGDISTLGYYEQLDVEAALDFALAQEGVEHVGAWGGSMGGATVIMTGAKRSEIEAIVADSAFPSLEEVIRINAPFDFMMPFIKYLGKYHSGVDMYEVMPVNEISKISPRAVFIIDGWEGGAIAMNAPYRLYDAADEPKQIWVEDGIPHLGMLGNDSKQYENRVIEFFDEYLLNEK